MASKPKTKTGVEEQSPKRPLQEGKRRVVIEVDKNILDETDTLANLFGKPQYVVVERALKEYIRQNKKAIDSFKEIRAKVLANFDVETSRLEKYEEEQENTEE